MVGLLVGGCRCVMSLCDNDMTFDLVIVTLFFESCLGNLIICKLWEVDTWLGCW